MNKACLSSLIFGLVFVLIAASADPLVAFPTGNCAWTVRMTPAGPSSDGSAPAPTPAPATTAASKYTLTQVEVTQVDGVKRVRFTFGNGTTSEEWTLPGLAVVFKEDPRNGDVFPAPQGGMGVRNEKASTRYDLAAFNWLNHQSLKEKTPISYKGKPCFHYLIPGSSGAPNLAAGATAYNTMLMNSRAQEEAWIDAKTLLPVALQEGGTLYSFTFPAEPPTGPLAPPANIQKAIDHYKLITG